MRAVWNGNKLNLPSGLDCWDPNTGIFTFLFIYYFGGGLFLVTFGVSSLFLVWCHVKKRALLWDVFSSLFKKSSWKRSSLLPSVLGLKELWLIRTTLLYTGLTCGNICNSFLVREISERTWFDFQTHIANENQPPESGAQLEHAKVFYPPLTPPANTNTC